MQPSHKGDRIIIHILSMRKSSTGRVSDLPRVTQPVNSRAEL